MRPLIEQALKSAGVLSVNTATPAATASRINGWAYDSTGKPYVTSAGAAVPATAVMSQGIAFTPLGAMYMTDTAPAASALTHQGFSIRSDGALHVNSAAVPALNTRIGAAAVASGRLHESGL